ncbi:RNA 2'-phosphotransferase [Pseudomonas sp. TUM22785]|uniref:RNA 2'-phosphotransferase n=1 Tax=Pseudomonas sp. TUM22785 TaxID=3019098 RepID=UPI00161938DA|nr:RNA 2'-phosphotransferase [Pseudomonas sp. TUM22785]MBB4817316.1 putative RNA 2'-phosphotransferase [Pseudomonas alcaligenes]WCD78997.1 RNA 2'-phosphotransferase [Pseudomonas sp. TUM22785]
MSNGPDVEISRFLSFVLRHKPEAIGLQLDSEGWADIEALITGAARTGKALDERAIRRVVANNDKKRFAISEDGRRIRAVQGHSTASVQRQYDAVVPPQRLFHGTASRFVDSILQKGLIAGSRHHVHLSEDRETATQVGQRYGEPVILEIAASAMHEVGFEFHQAENGVWLTARVPVDYLKREG